MSGEFSVTDGEYSLRLDPVERSVLRSAIRLLDGGDDAGGRLDYTAHPDDPDAERRYRDLVGDSLDDLRRADREMCDRVVRGDPSPPEAVEAFMRVVGEVRLVLAARAGIDSDGWEYDASPDDAQLAVVGWLGHLQDAAVRTLTGPLDR